MGWELWHACDETVSPSEGSARTRFGSPAAGGAQFGSNSELQVTSFRGGPVN